MSEYVPFKEIVGPTYTLSSLNAECQRCVNLQVEEIESGDGQNEYYLKETPGLLAFSNLALLYPDQPIQDIFVSQRTPYNSLSTPPLWVAIGTDMVTVAYDGTVTVIGKVWTNPLLTVPPGTFVENASGMFYVASSWVTGDPGGIWSYEWNSGAIYFIDNPTGNFTGAGSAAALFLDQRLLVIRRPSIVTAQTAAFQISPLNMQAGNSGSWSASELYPVESSVDNLVMMVKAGSLIWCFGTSSYEVFIDTGGSNLHVFARVRDAAFPIGTNSPGSCLEVSGSVFWLGLSPEGLNVVYMSEGLTAKRVSTLAIERLIQAAFVGVPFANIYSWKYTLEGHSVYVITINELTVAYDLTTGVWHELAYRDPDTGVAGRHRIRKAVTVFGKIIGIDHTLGYLYEYSPSTYTDNSAPIIRYRRAPVIASGQRNIFHKKLEFNMEVGSGLPSDPFTAPQMYIRWSDDNGYTWGNYHNRSIGKLGEYSEQVIFNRLGRTRHRVYEVYFNEAVPIRIISAELLIAIGIH